MYLVMNSNLVVETQEGTLKLGGLNQVGGIQSIEIVESVTEMGASCKVTVPQNIRSFEGKSLRDYLREGDRAYVYFGYDGDLFLEFSGYLLEIPTDAPMELVLADEFYPLRKNSITKSYRSVTLKQLLNDIAPGYKIVCADVSLGKKVFDRKTSFQILQEINETDGFYTYIKGNTLYCQFAYDVRGLAPVNHVYYMCDEPGNKAIKKRSNIRKNNLKYKRADTSNIRVEVVVHHATGKKFKHVVGSAKKDAAIRKMEFGSGMTDKEAVLRAEKMHESLSFDGYRGTITGYGLPRTMPGDSATLINFDFPDQSGTYLIEKVIRRYSKDGIERENTLSFKI